MSTRACVVYQGVCIHAPSSTQPLKPKNRFSVSCSGFLYLSLPYLDIVWTLIKQKEWAYGEWRKWLPAVDREKGSGWSWMWKSAAGNFQLVDIDSNFHSQTSLFMTNCVGSWKVPSTLTTALFLVAVQHCRISEHINHMPERRIHIGIIYSYSNSSNPVTYFHWKIFTLAGIWFRDLPSTKRICYQLSYPCLDTYNFLTFKFQRAKGGLCKAVCVSFNVFFKFSTNSHTYLGT